MGKHELEFRELEGKYRRQRKGLKHEYVIDRLAEVVSEADDTIHGLRVLLLISIIVAFATGLTMGQYI